LFGVFGGFLGLTAAYALSFVLPVSLLALEFLLAGLGVSGGVLAYRLSRGLDVERRLDMNRMASDEILDRIKRLPKDTPPAVRDQLWLSYQHLNSIPQMGLLPISSSRREVESRNDAP
jgi:hypothetical protein